MGRKKKKTVLGDVELLIRMLQKEWSSSKESVWRVEVPVCILKACNREIEGMSRYLHNMNAVCKDCESMFMEEAHSLFSTVYATKEACVLIRVAKKILAASKESVGVKRLILALDDEEYRFVVSRFSEYL